MPPKQAGVKLSSVKPSPEELAKAKAILTSVDSKAKKSKMASMAHYLKEHPGLNDEVTKSRGLDKQQYLENFLVHQLRLKQATKQSENSHEVVSKSSQHQKVRWLSEEVMDREIGATKAAHWRASGKLASRADSVTGSTEAAFVEWACPEDWDEWMKGETNSYAIKTNAEADEDDHILLKEATGRGSSSTTSEVEVKAEEKTAEEKLEDRARQLVNDPRPTLRKFQDYKLECERLVELANGVKYADGIAQDASKLIPKVGKLLKLLTTMSTKPETVKLSEVKDVVKSDDILSAQYLEIRDWGEKFGLIAKGKKRVKKQ